MGHLLTHVVFVVLLFIYSVAAFDFANNSSERWWDPMLAYSRPPGALVSKWYYQSKADEPYLRCTDEHTVKGEGPWIMLNAYRGGGKQNVHWKFTRDESDEDCLVDWTYYAKDGKWVMEHVKGRLTKDSKERTWCALAVYRKGGVRGYQWDYCTLRKS